MWRISHMWRILDFLLYIPEFVQFPTGYTLEPLLSDPPMGVTIRLDDKMAKISGLNGAGRVGLRSDN